MDKSNTSQVANDAFTLESHNDNFEMVHAASFGPNVSFVGSGLNGRRRFNRPVFDIERWVSQSMPSLSFFRTLQSTDDQESSIAAVEPIVSENVSNTSKNNNGNKISVHVDDDKVVVVDAGSKLSNKPSTPMINTDEDEGRSDLPVISSESDISDNGDLWSNNNDDGGDDCRYEYHFPGVQKYSDDCDTEDFTMPEGKNVTVFLPDNKYRLIPSGGWVGVTAETTSDPCTYWNFDDMSNFKLLHESEVEMMKHSLTKKIHESLVKSYEDAKDRVAFCHNCGLARLPLVGTKFCFNCGSKLFGN